LKVALKATAMMERNASLDEEWVGVLYLLFSPSRHEGAAAARKSGAKNKSI